jgi:hypothetical protein
MVRVAGLTMSLLAGAGALVAAVFVLPSLPSILLYLLIAAAFLAPGWPLARWVAGSDIDRVTRGFLAVPLGYAASGSTVCVLRLVGVSAPLAVLAVVLVEAIALAWVTRGRRDGVISLVSLGAADRVGIGVLSLLALAIVGPVFARVGEVTPMGLAYRAYFNADLFVHMTVVAELVKDATPPLNPFLPGEAFPYYWTYFTLPSLFASLQPANAVDRGILLTDIGIAVAFLSVGYIALRNFGASPLAATLAWVTILLASSFEGLSFIWMQWQAGRPLGEFRITNIDAVTRWYWSLPGVDGLHRGMWWTPQHLTALTFFQVVLLAAVRPRQPNGLAVGALEGLLLGAAFATSSFNGVMLVAWYAVVQTVVLGVDRGRDLGRWILARGLAAVMVVAFWSLATSLGMIQRVPDAFLIGWNQFFRNGPWKFVLLSFGPALFLAGFGVPAAWRASRRLLIALAGLVIVAAVFFLQVDLRGHENTQVTFRTGQLLYLALAVLLAFAIDAWRRRSRWIAVAGYTALGLGAAAALPTVALDWYNARDISNVQMNPGNFPWTLHINRDDQNGAEWVRQFVPRDATVQTDALIRDRNAWAFITAFAQRRMGTGNGLFTLNPGRYQSNLRDIHDAFSTLPAPAAHAVLRRIGVDYIYVGDVERRINGADSSVKFHARPDLFQPLYRRGSVEVFRVLR